MHNSLAQRHELAEMYPIGVARCTKSPRHYVNSKAECIYNKKGSLLLLVDVFTERSQAQHKVHEPVFVGLLMMRIKPTKVGIT